MKLILNGAKMHFKKLMISVACLVFPVSSLADSDKKLSGSVYVDGSSTVYPVSEAVAEEFQRKHPRVRVKVGLSGTGGGFKKFIVGETDINDASRPIKDGEKARAKKNNIEYIEIPIAYDGITVVVNKQNPLKSLTMAQLKKLWEPNSKVKTWKDLDSKLTAKPIKLYGPGSDSGTFDFFTEEVVGKTKASRSDYTASEDDNVMVRGVSKDRFALAYFGFAYYIENKNRLDLKSVALTKGKKTVEPTLASIKDQSYPLSRPLFIYVSRKAAKRPELNEFVRFYLKHAKTLAKEVGYVPLKDSEYKAELNRFDSWVTGNDQKVKSASL